MKLIASARVAGLSLNSPRTADVTVSVPAFFTPRIDMHRCSHWISTNTPLGLSVLDQRVGDLGGEALLHLGPAGEALDQPGDLRQPGDPAVVARDVRDVGHAVERREVVLARAEERDVAHHHHLVVVRLERHREVLARVLVQAREDLLVHRRDARRACAASPSRSGSSPIASRISRTARSMRGLVDRMARPDLGDGVQRIGIGHGLFLPFGHLKIGWNSRRSHSSRVSSEA